MATERNFRERSTASSPLVRAVFCLGAVLLGACDGNETLPPAAGPTVSPGGDTTVAVRGRKAYSQPAANLGIERRPDFFIGNAFFNSSWVAAPATVKARDGLGPYFNARSCDACHNNDGRGRPPPPGEQPISLVVQLTAQSGKGAYSVHRHYGVNINPFAVQGLQPEAQVEITYEELPGNYGDGTDYSLRRPRVAIIGSGASDAGDEKILMSARVAQAIVGTGLLESIPAEAIVGRADPDDADDDGISGRVNDLSSGTNEQAIGRFGWKANVASVRQQSANALFAEIGISSSLHPEQNCAPSQDECRRFADGNDADGVEISDELLDKVVFYQKLLGVPARRDADRPEVQRGSELFAEMRCAVCHTPEQASGANPEFPELAHQRFAPYTDLLIHDMGEGLADGRPDHSATGSEWRTAPLWGLGLLPEVNDHQFLLHDGRARGFAEAILWHGGEARAAREAFRMSNAEDRQALLAFLESL